MFVRIVTPACFSIERMTSESDRPSAWTVMSPQPEMTHFMITNSASSSAPNGNSRSRFIMPLTRGSRIRCAKGNADLTKMN